MKKHTLQAICNIQGYAAKSVARAMEHREKFEATGDRIHRIYWEHAAHNAAHFAAIALRELNNVA